MLRYDSSPPLEPAEPPSRCPWRANLMGKAEERLQVGGFADGVTTEQRWVF